MLISHNGILFKLESFEITNTCKTIFQAYIQVVVSVSTQRKYSRSRCFLVNNIYFIYFLCFCASINLMNVLQFSFNSKIKDNIFKDQEILTTSLRFLHKVNLVTYILKHFFSRRDIKVRLEISKVGGVILAVPQPYPSVPAVF